MRFRDSRPGKAVKKKKKRRKKSGKYFYCGTHGKMTKDHYVPKSKGGRFIVPCRHDCNQRKADKMPEDFIRDFQNLQKDAE